MSYSFYPGMVERNTEFLTLIDNASQREGGTLVKIPSDFQKWKLHQLLMACDMYPEEAGGRFVGLRERVKLGQRVVDGQYMLHIGPKRVGFNVKAAKIEAIQSTVDINDPGFAEVMDLLRQAEASAPPLRTSVWDAALGRRPLEERSGTDTPPSIGMPRPHIVGES